MTPLDKTLKRAIKINGQDYVITLSPDALKVSRKGHRLGVELNWGHLVSGESALAIALHASIGRFERQEVPRTTKSASAPAQRHSPRIAAKDSSRAPTRKGRRTRHK